MPSDTDNITREIVLNNKATRISLNKKSMQWALAILESVGASEINRAEYLENFVGTNYDIKTEANRLLFVYSELTID